MNKAELTGFLEIIAEKDLADNATIFDHPCSVAVRAIEQCFIDIKNLQRIALGNERNKSKKVQVLVKGIYDPTW